MAPIVFQGSSYVRWSNSTGLWRDTDKILPSCFDNVTRTSKIDFNTEEFITSISMNKVYQLSKYIISNYSNYII